MAVSTNPSAVYGEMIATGFVTPFAPAPLRAGDVVRWNGKRPVTGLLVSVNEAEDKATVIINRNGQFCAVWMPMDKRLICVQRAFVSPDEASRILAQIDGIFVR